MESHIQNNKLVLEFSIEDLKLVADALSVKINDEKECLKFFGEQFADADQMLNLYPEYTMYQVIDSIFLTAIDFNESWMEVDEEI